MNPLQLVQFVSRLATCALLVSLSGCSGNAGDGSVATIRVGDQGGVLLAPSDGPLAGASVRFAAGSIAVGTLVRMADAAADEVDGFVAVGPAIGLAPAGMELAASAELTLPYDGTQAALLGISLADDLVLLQRDDQGEVEVLAPQSFDDQSVSAAIDELAVYWVAMRPSAGFFPIADYLPQLGDSYSFVSGAAVFSERLQQSRFQAAVPILSWSAPSQAGALGPVPVAGHYLEVRPDGRTVWLGATRSQSGFLLRSYQMIAVGEVELLPAGVQEGQRIQQTVRVLDFDSLGPGNATRREIELIVEVGNRGLVMTPVGDFADAVDVRIEVEVDGATREAVTFWLARQFGPVAISTTWHPPQDRLQFANVRGRTIP